MNAVNSENILQNYGGNNVNSLNHILEFDGDDELNLLQKSQYFDDESLLKQLAKKTNTFKILSLNCQSINAKIDQLKIKIQQYKNDNCEFSAICLQETWLDSNADTSMLQIDDYTLISQGKTCSSHGGLLIYLHKHYKYKHLVGETSNIWEGQFIRVTDEETNTHVTIGNIYRPPRDVNENYQQFTEEFTRQLAIFQKSKGEVKYYHCGRLQYRLAKNKQQTKNYGILRFHT